MDGWIKMFEIDGDEKVAAVRYVNRRNIVSINQEGGGRIAAVMNNGDAVGMPEMPPSEAKLPYDAEIEYLESTGTQYIDTGVVPALSDTVSISFRRTAQNAAVFGCCNRVWSGGVAIYCGGFRYGATSWQNNTLNTVGSDVSVEMRGAELYVNGTLRTTFSAQAEEPQRSLYIFALHVPTGVNYYVSARCYSLSVSRNGTTLIDYIPVRVGSGSSAVGYLYDRANPDGGPLGNGLYGNAADGQGGVTGFPANCIGPDKPKP